MSGQREPLHYLCGPCDWRYPMGAETTVYQYIEQPWFDHLNTICPRCGRRYTVWNLTVDTVVWLEQANMTEEDAVEWAMPEDKAGVDLILRWLKDYLRFRPLTEHQIHEAQFFAWLLDNREDVEWHGLESA